jgi:hypothetical protein
MLKWTRFVVRGVPRGRGWANEDCLLGGKGGGRGDRELVAGWATISLSGEAPRGDSL